MKTFQVPITYRSPLITAIKNRRREEDKMKKDFMPTLLDLGGLHIYLARHFGFCYGVENAIEIAFRTIDEHPGKNIFLLSEMIHNPQVNADLQSRGVRFMQDTYGRQLIPFESLSPEDLVIIPAFGTTLEIEARLRSIGVQTEKYNTTCPFVEKVWNRSAQIAKKEYTVVVHGKPDHEETRATFSHAAAGGPTIVVKDIAEARELAEYIKASALAGLPDAIGAGGKKLTDFHVRFEGQYSEGFDPGKDLGRIGVVNQTTMLASDTQAIADLLRETMIGAYGGGYGMGGDGLGDSKVGERFADTRDTLCYATLDNQSAVMGMLETPADLAIVVGGYNSSNTGHLVELCEARLPAYFINSASNIRSAQEILHYNIHLQREELGGGWLARRREGAGPVRILITSGASCPDALVEAVIHRLASFFDAEGRIADLLQKMAGSG